MSAENLRAVLKIQKECHLSEWSYNDYLDELKREDSLGLVAQINEVPVGFLVMRLIISNSEAELYNIGISKENRRKGIGKSLIQQAISLCGLKNIENVWLEVRQSNKNAIDFYRSVGFQIAGRRKNFYQLPCEDAVLMKLSMNNLESRKINA
ncbi:MAG: ribosomal protein S18-alanine N-acetyltransferase [Pyrinomonadaceae bacterium]